MDRKVSCSSLLVSFNLQDYQDDGDNSFKTKRKAMKSSHIIEFSIENIFEERTKLDLIGRTLWKAENITSFLYNFR